MMQGDCYGLEIEIKKADGTAVTDSEVSDVEITVGRLTKTFAKEEVSYSGGCWVFHLTQEETFRFPAGRAKAQVRVVWKDGTVEGVPIGEIPVFESISKVVLE